MRTGSGAWVRMTDWTTATARDFDLQTGKTYAFRVKARDDAGNKSRWSDAMTVSP
jgi:hypothetical protein